ncbi:MAG: ABC transporter substrate-binding protein [Gallionella sp.]
MKYLFRFIVCLLCVANAAQAEIIAPDVLIKTTVDEVLSIVKHDKDIKAGNQQKILEMVESKVLPHFDFVHMTRLSVGKSWRTATPEQKQALVSEYRNLLVRTYTKAFTIYRDQTVEIKPLKMAADATEVTVKTTINKPGAAPIPVNYEMEKGTNTWKVFDLTIEGVSLVTSYRGTFNSEIQEKGIDGLIQTLSDKNKNAGLRTAEAK